MKNILINFVLSSLTTILFSVSINAQTKVKETIGPAPSNPTTAKINDLVPIMEGTQLKRKTLEKPDEGAGIVKDNVPQLSRNQGYLYPTKKERLKRYVNRTAGTGLIGVTASSVVQQFTETPPEWRQDSEGFVRRIGSNFGKNALSESVAYGLEETLKLDSRFYKSKKKDFRSRVKNALLSSFTARRPSGRRVFNPSRIAGRYTGDIIASEVWYPKRYSYKDGLRQATRGIGFGIGVNFLREFLFPN